MQVSIVKIPITRIEDNKNMTPIFVILPTEWLPFTPVIQAMAFDVMISIGLNPFQSGYSDDNGGLHPV